jgi:cytochrome c biogenesis protein CcmG/thiol:disulfide interchange protein DsbE
MSDLTQETVTAKQETPARKRSLGSIVAFVLILSLLAILGWRLVDVNRGQVESGLAPEFSLTNFEGETVTLSQFRGQVVIVNFWASWCPPCREEAPYLEATWRKYKDDGVVFIGVDYADTEVKALAYL